MAAEEKRKGRENKIENMSTDVLLAILEKVITSAFFYSFRMYKNWRKILKRSTEGNTKSIILAYRNQNHTGDYLMHLVDGQ